MWFFVAFLGTIVGANWALSTFGVVPLGALLVPAGAFFAGLSFTLRDAVQERLGIRAVLAAVVTGALLSALLSPTLALASGLAFFASELLDLAVYTPLRRRNWWAAVALSNTVGLVVDSMLFLSLAFGSLAFLPGQLVGKVLTTVATLAVVWGYHALLSRNTHAKLAR